MRTIGLIGGMSWESSAEYYRIANEEVQRRLGGTHSAPIVLFSFDFAEIETLQEAGDWDAAAARLVAAARTLEAAGAELLVICTNTMHRLAPEVEAATAVPLIHIADATAAAVHRDGVGTVGLLGTRYTMEEDFYRGRLAQRHGLEVLIPGDDDRALVHDVIYRELVRGVVTDESRIAYEGVMGRLVARGARGIILGCTEIELLVDQARVDVPAYPTTRIHALAAVEAALAP
jgi:aspartate racemase